MTTRGRMFRVHIRCAWRGTLVQGRPQLPQVELVDFPPRRTTGR